MHLCQALYSKAVKSRVLAFIQINIFSWMYIFIYHLKKTDAAIRIEHIF